MADFMIWLLSNQLQTAGWPKKKGLLGRRLYVNAGAVDEAIENGLMVATGLGEPYRV